MTAVRSRASRFVMLSLGEELTADGDIKGGSEEQ